MRKDKNKFVRPIRIYVTDEDYKKLQDGLSTSTCRSLSDYGRKLLLRKRLNVFYRNKSFDLFIDEAVALRAELQRIAATSGAEKLLPLMEEIKLCINKIYDHVCENRVQP